MSNLTTPASVQKLQTALHDKAKESPSFRFYALYDKVYRKDVLAFAYACCKANGGAAGVDNQTFEDIETYGEERWLDELAQELKNRTYQPLPVRRVYIRADFLPILAVWQFLLAPWQVSAVLYCLRAEWSQHSGSENNSEGRSRFTSHWNPGSVGPQGLLPMFEPRDNMQRRYQVSHSIDC